MLSKVEIANLALGRLGVTLQVVDIATDTTKEAKVIRQQYSVVFRKILEMHEWKFATKQSPLVLLTEDPNENFRYSYAYPADAQIIRQVAQEGIFPMLMEYEDQKVYFEEVEGNVIYTNERDAHAKYTKRVLETSSVPDHFGEAVAAQLSIAIAPSLITNNFPKVINGINMNAKNDISDCIARDESRGPQKQDSYNPFYRSRLG